MVPRACWARCRGNPSRHFVLRSCDRARGGVRYSRRIARCAFLRQSARCRLSFHQVLCGRAFANSHGPQSGHAAIAARALHEDSAKIRGSHDQHLTLSDVSSSPMALVLPAGNVTVCNPVFNRYCGVDLAEGRAIETILTLPELWKSEV